MRTVVRRVADSEIHLNVDFDPKYGKHVAAPHRVRGEHGYLASVVCALDTHLGACGSSLVHSSAIPSELNAIDPCVPVEFDLWPVWYSALLGVL